MASVQLPTSLDTARLRLVRPDLELAPRLAEALNASYGLHQDFLSWSKPHWSTGDTRDSLRRALEDFPQPVGEKKFFLLLRAETEPLVGCVGLKPRSGDEGGFDLGYWVRQGHARQGLMKEALAALIGQLAGQPLGLTTSSANIASQRLAQAVGFQCIQTITAARRSATFGICDTLVYQRPAL
ncbi:MULTISPECIES: GNAT family N-acetyltransferase [Pseudomonas]|uniref:N-acetyltransferase GCN5 n=2 Tax=Pseudomonas chlororaphis TaxID=587753 RepID=A0AAX3FNL5_9PSED|nr:MULTISPECIES: GNAT family N-acetyltransferase [Pseudomonas]AVO59162.1 N-acetyltransferase [Pseudomonas chlororaphis subsp. piscium]AZC37547.1 putative ribosomal protein N-acetyltransferase [Pseudomonas chlororaphis subsp. piscium]AZC44096.1 putative ribosomal protein N-acetyltransferase [Pseudomonas chlororaphis subsp. piscium]AZC50751.1 putative ribosomal protein N-acetyltransferase [Pseudomonas chlororaphis subsp. piscium]AZC57323.1 putative ribosomal protein N-acetyltransferase [Pseudomo